MALLGARGLEAGYGSTVVLRGVTFEVAPRTTFALVGPGGSGKSTLLRLLAGEGDAWHRGELLRPTARARTLPQRESPGGASLQARLGGAEPAARLLEELRGRDASVAAAWEAALLLPCDGLPRPLRRLAAFFAAVAGAEPVLLLDEPETALTAPLLELVIEKLCALRGERTILLVTHNVSLARRVCDAALLLVEGEVVENAAAPRFFEAPAHPRTRHYVEMGC